ncbi:MAG: hypothetical protein NUV91_01775, partial [Candidatus Omnitrophica bacterium]|nr:hypothetical protein [Candidatus Omnitrophota bacterium]
MKRPQFFILIACLFIVLSVSFKPLVIFYAQKQIKKTLGATVVSIKSCHFQVSHHLSFLNVKIQKTDIYDLNFEEIGIEYRLRDIWKRKIQELLLKNGTVVAQLDKVNLKSDVNSASAKIAIDKLSILDSNLNLKFGEFNVEAK